MKTHHKPTDREPITAAERYARATVSSDLTAYRAEDHRCDADRLIAAGWAAQDPDRALALSAYRMALTGDLQGLHDVAERCAGWINAWCQRKGRRVLTRSQRIELATQVLAWWVRPVCGYCEGRCFELMPSEHEDGVRALSGQYCQACHGTGRRPLAREVPAHLQQPAEYVESRLNNLVLQVTGEMGRRLAARVEA